MKCPKCQSDNPSTQKFCGECATALTSAEEAHPSLTKTIRTPIEQLTRGTLFADRYEIIEELGRGGMGRVYRVDDKKINQEIALKLIRSEIGSDKNTIERFSNELRSARMVAHKNVCRMFDLGEDRGTYFITMEYVTGEDLKSMIKMMGRMSPRQAISLVSQICDGLSEAHRLGIVHRDLKPNNIMIDKQGHARIMDFGIARSLKGKGITGAGIMIGTPEYMSPEQVEAKEVDARSDIYSLGIILYETTTGRLPFEADSAFAVGVKQKSERPPDPREVNPQVSEELSRVILKCLEKEKDNRFQSADELRSQLLALESALPTSTGMTSEKKPLTSREITVTLGLKKTLIPALIVFSVVTAAVLLWLLLPKKSAAPVPGDKPSLAVLYFKNSTGNSDFDVWRTALSDSIITDLLQSKYIKVLTVDRLISVLKKLDLMEATAYATEDLKAVASEGGVSHILHGSLSRSGSTFRINYTLQDISGDRIVGSERVEGSGEDSIFSMIDGITKLVKRDLDLTPEQIAGDIDRDIGAITTHSTEALKYYTEGRTYHLTGEYEKSINLMDRALAIDPDFAMAYRSLSVSYNNQRYYGKSREYMQKAFELSGRISDRERYLIEGDFYRNSDSTLEKSLEAFNKLLELYPDDGTALNNSAIIYLQIEDWDEAIKRYSASNRIQDGSMHSYTGLASAYLYTGQHEKALAVLQEYLDTYSDRDEIHGSLAEVYICMREFDSALDEINQAIALNPMNFGHDFNKGSYLLLKGDIDRASSEFSQVLALNNPLAKVLGNLGWIMTRSLQGKAVEIERHCRDALELSQSIGNTGWEFSFRSGMAQVYMDFGDYEGALREIEEARRIAETTESFSQKIRNLTQKGSCLLSAGSVDEGIQTAEQLKSVIEAGLFKNDIRNYYYLLGRIEHEKKNFAKAIEYLEKSKTLLPFEYSGWDMRLQIFFALGRSYREAGQMDQARDAFEAIGFMTFGRMYGNVLYVRAFYELGKVYQAMGNNAKALEKYRIFLDLWKDADSGFQEVADARERVAALKNQ
jgi:tetratricopeptide (TPR) repeat protein/TolB-like protein/tRNA A-37 threonylcarbamoyl transferase component Bud32